MERDGERGGREDNGLGGRWGKEREEIKESTLSLGVEMKGVLHKGYGKFASSVEEAAS